MKVKIYQPVRNVMQSGRKTKKYWLIEPINENVNRYINPLMPSWITTNSTSNQLCYKFNTKEEAIHYATSQGFEYLIQPGFSETVKKKSYSGNFTAPILY